MALTGNRSTKVKFVQDVQAYKMAGATHIYAGGMVAVNATGYAVPADDAANLKVVGWAEEEVDNTGADGALKVRVAKGVVKMGNAAAADAVVQADVGVAVDVIDDETVATPGGAAVNSIPAGKVREIDADGGIWIECGL